MLHRELETVAGELERMSAGSSRRMIVPSASSMRKQLDSMLEQRKAAEAFQAELSRHRMTQNLLEEESDKLRSARSEVGTTCMIVFRLETESALASWLQQCLRVHCTSKHLCCPEYVRTSSGWRCHTMTADLQPLLV